MKFGSNEAKRDAIVLAALIVAVWVLAIWSDFSETMHYFLAAHEGWQADEFLVSLAILGAGATIYAYRRMHELRRVVRVRDAAEGRAVFAAYSDVVTGLFNRRYIETYLPELKAADETLGTIFAIDLDGFKKVNDLVGHEGGDKLLTEVAHRLVNYFPDGVCARLGGDEFVVVAPRIPEDEVLAVGEGLIGAIRKPVTIDEIEVEVGASVGIAEIPAEGGDCKAAIHDADLAMYTAKRDGENLVRRVDPAMLAAFRERLDLERAFRAALAQDLIRPHYQPLIRLETGDIRGFEALARWTMADGTAIPPSVFIPLAEENGLITELSERLLRRACLDAQGWPKEVFLTFNLSPLQFSDPLLGLRIVQILGETGMPPSRLEIEMTESAIVKDFEGAVKTIRQLQGSGIRVALDDFGTGFSSLSQLALIPFDKIKIDRSFTSSCRDNAKQSSMVRSIIGLGHGIGVATLAEGIENAAQFELLRAMGCEYGQGFLFARPMPPEEVAGYLGLASVERLPLSA